MGLTDPCTDLANAERLIERYGDRFRYVTTWNKWISWTGTRWSVDDAGVMRFAMKSAQESLSVALAAYKEAAQQLASVQATEGSDTKDAKQALARASKYVAHATKSQSASSIRAAIGLAMHAENIAIAHTAFDADPYLLNVANGTIDLRTGTLRPHDSHDLITKIAPIAFDPAATAPRWEAFLSWAMHGNLELVAYLQRIVGYAAIGVVREHVLGFCFGEDGKNGKSTFLGRIHNVFGEYARPAPRGLLFTSRTAQHPTELAALYGARFVTCSEVEQGQSFDEAKVKDLTGGDPISARRMKEDFWTFVPTHTLFIAGNHKPTVKGTDGGIWRRIRLIPWLATVALHEIDPDLPARLDAEAPGILAWVVRGALEWQRIGLGDPIAVTEATEHYREESDPLGEFFALGCVFEDGAKVARKMLRTAYEEYAADNGAKPIDAKAFAKRLRERGVADGDVWLQGKTVNGWRGVRLRNLEVEPVNDPGTSVHPGTNGGLLPDLNVSRRAQGAHVPRSTERRDRRIPTASEAAE